MNAYSVSRFTVCLPVSKNAVNYVSIYNTLTQAHVLMPADQWQNIEHRSPEADGATIRQLKSWGLLVSRRTDETLVFHHWMNRHVHDFSVLRSKVLVTRKCNNRCIYCIIESEDKEMSEQTARQMDNFYLNEIQSRRPGTVRDDYLGGEPLLNSDVLFQSAARRYRFCSDLGVDYSFTVTTNGTLITADFIGKLKAVGLRALRVSMAGPPEVHDVLRPLKGGGGTFERIMRNLKQISGMMPIIIECQYDAGGRDYLHLPDMLDDFSRHGIKVEEINYTPILAKRNNRRFCCGMGDVEILMFLQQQSQQRGYGKCLEAPSNACMADFRSIFVFDTDGALIPCPSLQSGEMAYGSAVMGVDLVAESQILARRLPQKCLRYCELLPVCLGGCRLQALTKGLDFNGVDCHYETFRRLLEWYMGCEADNQLSNN